MPSRVYVACIGVGGVGKAFVNQLAAYSSRNPQYNITPILLSRSSKALVSTDYTPISITSDWATELSTNGVSPPSDTLSFLTSVPDKSAPIIFVDNTSSLEIAETYPSLLRAGISVISASKRGFAGNISLWNAIFSAARNGSGASNAGFVFHESSCGAGLPVISTLKDLVQTGDRVKRIEGIFSGTMSFLFNSFAPLSGDNGGKGFAECVLTARDLGYTEPDPRDDLNGLDVARKLTILARISGLDIVEPTSFPIESLIPAELEGKGLSTEEFLKELPKFDAAMTAKKEAAEKEGSVVRYTGSIDVETKQVKVGLQTFAKSTAIAGLQGSDNIISFYTERYGSNPLIVQGAGAGAEVTAMGVLSDFIKVVDRT